jgi:hypothetical protein
MNRVPKIETWVASPALPAPQGRLRRFQTGALRRELPIDSCAYASADWFAANPLQYRSHIGLRGGGDLGDGDGVNPPCIVRLDSRCVVFHADALSWFLRTGMGLAIRRN